jgi:5'-nucleotidase
MECTNIVQRASRKGKETDMKRDRRTGAVIVLVFLLALAGQCTGLEHSVPKILVSNDDGIDAPGLVALVEALQDVGTVTVAAPEREQSGISHGMTTRRLIAVRGSERSGVKWYGIDATPGSCVRLALECLLPARPDIVVSGINRGENVGLVTFYSATVAAAREASFLRIPAVAINLQGGEAMDYKAAARFVAALVRELVRGRLDQGLFLNINIPALPRERIRGIMLTSLDTRTTQEFFEKKEARNGETLFWPSFKVLDAGPEGTDTWAVRNGFISITPLSLDQTDAARFKSLEGLIKLDWK